MIDQYRDRNLIVRSASPSEIVSSLRHTDCDHLRFIQLLSDSEDASVLEDTGDGIPIEVFLSNPVEYQRLYKFVSLLDCHPLRIAIPVAPGFSKAVKLAVSLNYAVKLEVEQPDQELVEELESVLELYLHRTYVRQPIEFFQSMLLSMYRNEEVSLWAIAEENPKQVRYITDDGEETVSKRFVGLKLDFPVSDFVTRFGLQMLGERQECFSCEFFNRCGGYFKWPDKSYPCTDIKRVFQTLSEAMREVREDLAKYQAMGAQT
jgi:hypothetical protein